MKVKAVVLESALKLDQHCSDGEMYCRSICVVNSTSRLGCYCENSGQCSIGQICYGWRCAH